MTNSTPRRTAYGLVTVTMPNPDTIIIDTLNREGDGGQRPVTINGVKYDLGLRYVKRDEAGWRDVSNAGIKRNGWENWSKPVSDAAWRKVREMADTIISEFDTPDRRNLAAYSAAKQAVESAESTVARIQKELDEALTARLTATADLHEAYGKVVVVRPRHPMNPEGLVCGSCGADSFINHPRTLDNYNFECVGCGRHYAPLTETGASR